MSQHFHHNPVRVKSGSLFATASEALQARLSKIKRKDKECQAYFRKVIKSTFFQIVMITTVTTNSFLLVLGTNYDIQFEFFRTFEGNHSAYLHFADGIQSLRILKLISYSRGIRTLIIAVGETVYTVASVLTLLFLLMFVFAILGFCLFGVTDRGDLENWGNLASAFFTLFSLATVDGWTDLQEELDKRKFTVSRAFTILFILLASFIFLNMFVGVMIMHTEDSMKKFERDLTLERNLAIMEEKQIILKRQQEEVNRLMNTQKSGSMNFIDMVEGFKKTLRHTDPMVLDDFSTSLSFIDIYLVTLDNQDVIVSKLQELYCEIVNVLSLMLEDMPKESSSSLSGLS
ncbi:cation channel sperm-associated protein 3 isoform 3 [Mus musculus]|uniref:Cation channel sperm-associated protein 3 transcript variant 3 n=1 Tax=Mus musculus TaxID=10090 RepID=E0Z0E1_MOUSE|nr:cation channel sperm-associated protein 3 isoform 3 [Mus musculus]ADM47600.1 cation channel sperm-associated protein 3 transcript variant 3 [Mus musculus]|eukprot:NP_001239417.1 cation channel sperm-associated protein 3 isoform 3 [Mus musculus]